MNVLADTNIILDVILKREPFFAESYRMLNLSAQDKIHMMITASSITDIYYLLRKSGKDDVSSRQALNQLLFITHLADVRAEDIHRALQSPVVDFEDAVAVEVARRHGCEVIITRNVKDFSGSAIPAIIPQDFDSFKPDE
jgi:predicted nucleic acid-binding protein